MAISVNFNIIFRRFINMKMCVDCDFRRDRDEGGRRECEVRRKQRWSRLAMKTTLLSEEIPLEITSVNADCFGNGFSHKQQLCATETQMVF